MKQLSKTIQPEVKPMMKFALSLMFLLSIIPAVYAQRCDCTITPFKPSPPCFDECTVNLLAGADLKDLRYAFGLKKDTAEKLLAWQKDHHPTSLKEYFEAEILTTEDLENLKKRVDSFSQRQLEYLARPSEERNTFTPGEIRFLFR